MQHNLFDNNAIERVKICTDHVVILTQIEGSMLMQRAKINWLQLKDCNNFFFHASVKEKSKHKGLYTLIDLGGNNLTNHEALEDEVLNFYPKLVGTRAEELDSINLFSIRNGSMMSRESAQRLIRPIKENEV